MGKRYSSSLKGRIVLEILESERSILDVAREYDMHPNTVRNWVSRSKSEADKVFDRGGENKELKKQIRELEQLLGKKEREIALLKNFLG